MILLLALAPTLLAQQNKVNIAPSDPLTVKRGESAKQVLKAVILDGFHVNSDKPRDEYLIPLKLTWDTPGPLEAKAISYPKPEELELNGSHMLVYTGTVPIETEFVVAKNATKGPTAIVGKLKYQACNSNMCFAPKILEVKVPVVIE